MSMEYSDLCYRRVVKGLKRVIRTEEVNYLYKMMTPEEVLYMTNYILADYYSAYM